jgi:hypothetical protein
MKIPIFDGEIVSANISPETPVDLRRIVHLSFEINCCS